MAISTNKSLSVAPASFWAHAFDHAIATGDETKALLAAAWLRRLPRPMLAQVHRPPLWRNVRSNPAGGHVVAWQAMTADRGPYRLTFDGAVATNTWEPPREGWAWEATIMGYTVALAELEEPADINALNALYNAVYRTIIYNPDATGAEIERLTRASIEADRKADAEYLANPGDSDVF